MASSIPAGYGIIPGRGVDKARAAIKAAEDAGFPGSVVRTHREGYLVPNEVLDQYQADSDAAASKSAEESDTKSETEPKKPAAKRTTKASTTKKDEE